FEAIEIACRVAASDHGADRRAGNDVGNEPLGDQRADHADMRKPACRAAAEHKPDRRALRVGFGLALRQAVFASGDAVAILSAAEKIKHPNAPSHIMLARAAPCASPSRRYGEKDVAGQRAMLWA